MPICPMLDTMISLGLFSSHRVSKAMWILKSGLVFRQWNCRALLHHSGAKRQQKGQVLWSTLFGSDILALQEVHVSKSAMYRYFAKASDRYRIFASAHEKTDTGGVVIAIKKHIFDHAVRVEHDRSIDGRFQIVHITYEDNSTIALANLHNFGLDLEQMSLFRSRMTALHSHVTREGNSSWALLMGDFNLPHKSSKRTPFNKVGVLTGDQQSCLKSVSVFHKHMHQTLDSFLEIRQARAT